MLHVKLRSSNLLLSCQMIWIICGGILPPSVMEYGIWLDFMCQMAPLT